MGGRSGEVRREKEGGVLRLRQGTQGMVEGRRAPPTCWLQVW